MPKNVDISINDGKASPIAHVFGAQNSEPDGGQGFVNRAATRPSLRELLTFRRFRPKKTAVAQRQITLTRPVEYMIGGVPVVKYSTMTLNYYPDPDFSVADRKDDRVMFANLLAHASVVAFLDNDEGITA